MGYGFYECFLSDDGETLDFICNSAETKPMCPEFNRSQVKILKYQCDHTVGTTNFFRNVINTLPNLSTVNVSCLQSSFFSIPMNVKFAKIEILKASRNQLTEIPSGIFDQMPNIIEIDFSWNKFTKILLKHLTGADHLTKIDVMHNNIGYLDAAAFGAVKNLEVLDLSYNKLESIEDNVFKENDKLKLLNLRHNKLLSFNFRIFSPSATDIEVYLPSRSIERLDIGCIQSVCHFKGFQDGDNFDVIKTFKAEGNKFSNFSILFEKLGRSLETLILSRCMFETITHNLLEKFTSLTTIMMTNANISSIEANAFSYQTRLVLLDLSYNKLTDVDSTLFSRKFHDLETLYLEGNQLQRIDNITSANLPKLQSIFVTKNRFSCNYLVKYVVQWKKTIQFGTRQSDVNVVNVRGIDCSYADVSEKSCETETPHSLECPSTLPYIIIITFLNIVLSVIVATAIYWRRKSFKRTVGGLIKTDAGIQTMDSFESAVNMLNNSNNDSFYEEIELKSIPSEGYQTLSNDVLTLESRPLPTPPTTLDKTHKPNHHTSPLDYQYAQVCKR
ncbi:leucine-rich repeat and immunoglobulin-like domain-containing nogo receptor-interacting protein 2 [Contarinia nasturtii]|uniref:leucine-rich repeat and immunoglobulin-like domain-containing nogo receptor-interacting protein 2 n=1 Tax=Contarinia nasturtii TaxID=265458 RepID=UPI0012D471E0|nr:leucine-rich repeat and immunoglobulin-like domain-containing nogo receptor-interacting protein 2 [Contarinia nasturtii]